MLRTLLVVQLLAVSPKDVHEAERLVHQSMREYDLADFDHALADATSAYELDPLPALFFNLGQCHRALRHWDKAAFFFRRYLAKLPNAPNRKVALELLAEADAKANAREMAVGPVLPPPAAAQLAPSGAPSVLVLAPSAEAVPPPEPVAASVLATPGPPPRGASASAPPRRHTTRLLALGLLAGGILAGGVAAVGQVQVQGFLSNRAAVRSPTTGSYTQLFNEQAAAKSWLAPSIVLGVLAAVGITGAVLTW